MTTSEKSEQRTRRSLQSWRHGMKLNRMAGRESRAAPSTVSRESGFQKQGFGCRVMDSGYPRDALPAFPPSFFILPKTRLLLHLLPSRRKLQLRHHQWRDLRPKAEKKPGRGVQVEKPRLVLWRVNTMPICRLCKGGRLSFPYDRVLGLGVGVELGLGLG